MQKLHRIIFLQHPLKTQNNPNKINELFEGINNLYKVCDLDKLLSIVNELNTKLSKGQSALDQIQIIHQTITKAHYN